MREASVPNAPHLTTPRLVLRPSDASDAARGIAIQSSWNVTRMLRMARFPPDHDAMNRWFADHPREWTAGRAYRFAIERDGAMIGLCDLDEIADGAADLGYWLDESAWGRGYATEAARAVIDFAFATLDLVCLRSGHAEDNAPSGHVLTKLGFQRTGTRTVRSVPRGMEIEHVVYELRRS